MGLSSIWYQINQREKRNFLNPTFKKVPLRRPIKELCSFHCYKNGTRCPIKGNLSYTCRCVSYICVVPAEFFPMFDHGMTTDQMPTSPLNFWASFFLMLKINCSKNLDVQLLLPIDSLPNLCPIYIIITR